MLKPGDKLTCITYYHGSPIAMADVTVQRVTPTGRIVTTRGEHFVADPGDKYTYDSYGQKSYSDRTSITTNPILIDKAETEIETKRIGIRLNNLDFRTFPLAKLRAILEITHEGDQP